MPSVRRVLLIVSLVALAAASACTVRPLYGDAAAFGPTTGTAGQLASVGINPANTREEQEVRNHLIFLLGGGAGEPADPRYSLALGVTAATALAATRQVAREGEPTAGTVTLTSRYSLTDNSTREVVASGRQVATASFDRSIQQFASMRAERDAQNRAARELAELLRLTVAQKLTGVSTQ